MIEEGVLAFPVYDELLFKGVDERLEFPTEEVNIALLLVELSFYAIIDSINDDELLDGFEARLEFTNKVSRYDELLLDGLKLGTIIKSLRWQTQSRCRPSSSSSSSSSFCSVCILIDYTIVSF